MEKGFYKIIWAIDKMKTEGKMQLDGIIVKYCTGMVINWEGIGNREMSQLKIGTGPQLEIRKELERWVKHFESVLNWDKVAGIDIEENEYLGSKYG